ncbi:sedoheptulose-1,7-bisphosphatase [Poronia punctata]|nr:sedoheptulose-1,7-bisphosphatase [Poronia punctata]
MSTQEIPIPEAEPLHRATGGQHPNLVHHVIPSLLRAIGRTAEALRTKHAVQQAGSANVFGDAQLNVDVLAEDFFRREIESCEYIVTASSEEDPVEKSKSKSTSTSATAKGVYTVAFDPLDGSSIIGPNWSVGCILGIWEGATALGQDPTTRQIAAVLGVFGPRNTAIIAVRVPGREDEAACLEVGIKDGGEDGSFEIIRQDVKFQDQDQDQDKDEEDEGKSRKNNKYFAPANLRAASEDPRYLALVTRYIRDRYTLRYSGGLVPDVVHALVKGHGVYLSPVTRGSKAKLRRAYELLPVALVVECAGGKAIDPVDGRRILERRLVDLDETAGLICGTSAEVDLAREVLLG